LKNILKITAIMAILVTWCSCDVGGEKEDPILSDADAVSNARTALDIIYQSDDNANAVTEQITLPMTASNGVTVQWASDNTAAISNSGLVSRPSFTAGNTVVVMTATLSKGEATDTKIFNLTVLANDPSILVLNDWTNLSGIDSTCCVAVNSTSLYAGTIDSGLVYSDDGGSNWTIMNASNDLADNQVNCIFLSGDKVYIGTYQGLTLWDRGSTETITHYKTANVIRDICINNNMLYLASGTIVDGEEGIYYGYDPANLTYISTGFEETVDLFINNGYLYATGNTALASDAEILKYSLADMTIEPVELDLVSGASSAYTGPLFVSGNRIIGSVNSYPYYSSDGGSTFTYKMAGGGAVTGYAGTSKLLFCVKYGSDLWYTTDLGDSWDSYSIDGYDGFTGISAKGISIWGDYFYIAHNGGLLKEQIE